MGGQLARDALVESFTDRLEKTIPDIDNVSIPCRQLCTWMRVAVCRWYCSTQVIACIRQGVSRAVCRQPFVDHQLQYIFWVA